MMRFVETEPRGESDLAFKFHLEAGGEGSRVIWAFQTEVATWISDQMGGGFGTRWRMSGYTFSFRDSADAAAFKIRWG